MRNTLVWTVAVMILTLSAAVAGENKAAPGRRVALFDGKNLAKWDVLKCEALVQDGAIFIKGGNGLVQTKRKYADFILEFDWKSLKDDNWDSGVYFRYDSIPDNSPWPKLYQANLRKGSEGNISGLNGATSRGLFKNGEWNSFKLTVRGSTAEMEINGKPAWKADGLDDPKEGFIGLQSEVPGGGQCLFRNVYITELK
jgi:hypothetical protein